MTQKSTSPLSLGRSSPQPQSPDQNKHLSTTNTISQENQASTERRNSNDNRPTGRSSKNLPRTKLTNNDSQNSSFQLEKGSRAGSNFTPTKTVKKKRKSINKTVVNDLSVSRADTSEGKKKRMSVIGATSGKSNKKVSKLKLQKRKTLVDDSISLTKIENKRRKSITKTPKKGIEPKSAKKQTPKRRKSKSLGQGEVPKVTVNSVKKVELNPNFSLVADNEPLHALYTSVQRGFSVKQIVPN